MGIFKRKNKQSTTSTRRQPAKSERAQTYSYFQSRDEPSTQTKRNLSLKHRLRHLPTYVAILVIGGAVLYAATLTTNPKIVVVNEDDEQAELLIRDTKEYQRIAAEQLSSSVLNRTKLTINTDSGAEALRASIPEATDLSIVLPLIGRNPIVYIQVAQPRLIMKTSDTGSFIIDEQGRAVVDAQSVPKETKEQLLVVTDKSGLAVTPGSYVLTQQELEMITEVEALLSKANIEIKQLELPLSAGQINVYPVGEKYHIKLSSQRGAREQVGAFLATKQQLAKDNAPAAQYIDVRVDGKTYVK